MKDKNLLTIAESSLLTQLQNIYPEVTAERIRQLSLFGQQKELSLFEHYAILGEEVGEVANSLLEGLTIKRSSELSKSLVKTRKELIEVATVALAMVQKIDFIKEA